MLHFTGSGALNKQMRLKAIKMNMFLSETGLYTDSKKTKQIVCYTEEEILKLKSQNDIHNLSKIFLIKNLKDINCFNIRNY